MFALLSILNRGGSVLRGGSVPGCTTKVLLDLGADVAARNGIGGSALHAAAWRGCAEIVDLLVDAGADVSARCVDGKTALMYAAKYGHPEVGP